MPGADFYLYESIPDAVIVVARDSSIVFSNAHADRLFGYEPGELTSLKIDSLIPEEFRKRHVQVTEQYSAEPAARPMGKGRELVALKSDGREFPVEVAIGPTENEKATVAVIRDISPIVETRARLSDTETESRDLDRFLRNAPIGICYLDKELRYLRVNNWLAELNGIPVEEHLGRRIADVLPEAAPGIEKELRHVLRTGEPIINGLVEATTPAHPTTTRVFMHNYFPEKSSNGAVIGVSCVVQDVTEAREDLMGAQNELRVSEQRFRLAAAHTADTLQYINVEQDLYVWYTDVDRLMGYEPGGFPRSFTGWLGLIHPDDVDRIKAAVERMIEHGEPGWDFRYRIRAKDGSFRHWLDRGTVTGFVDGRPNEGVGAIVDETEQLAVRQELEKSLDEVRRALAENQALKDRLQAESQYLTEEIKSSHDFDEIIGNSAPMMATFYKVDQVAATDASVLLLGETGTGKELFARAIHARSKRSGRPLIKVDCTTLPSGLVESELFGHEKGAFTGAQSSKPGRFELADGGTIFLDEIGELSSDLQSKLLRVIQESEFQRLGSQRVRRVDVRIITATNRNLQEELRAGRFRSDLYYRIGVFPIEIPPLRDRMEDVPLLTSFFIAHRNKRLGRKVTRVSQAMMNILMTYDWPGNVRELENVVERAIIVSPGTVLEALEPFGRYLSRPDGTEGSLKRGLRETERKQILGALEGSHWKIKGEGNAASRLGLKPSTLRTRMKRLGIERPS